MEGKKLLSKIYRGAASLASGAVYGAVYVTNGIVYTVQDFAWRFQTTEPKHDQAYDNLKKYASPVEVNLNLDAQTVHIEGRLPQVLRTHPNLANKITTDAMRLSNESNDLLSRILDPTEKREYIRLITIPDALRHKPKE